jgi:hypothetical protein
MSGSGHHRPSAGWSVGRWRMYLKVPMDFAMSRPFSSRTSPAIEVPRVQLQPDRRATGIGGEKLHAEIVEERNVGAERRW